MTKKESKNKTITILVSVLLVLLGAMVGDSYARLGHMGKKIDKKVDREELKELIKQVDKKIDIVIKFIKDEQKD